MTDKKTPLWILFLAAAIFLALFIVYFQSFRRLQWDFLTYFHAAKVFFAGGNPFDLASLAAVNETNQSLHLPYIYHPYHLFLIYPLLSLGFVEAAKANLVINIGILFYFFWICHKFFQEKLQVLPFLVIIFFGFNITFFQALTSGNVAILMAALSWTAFYFLLKEKPFWFTFFIFIAAFFKLYFLLFLPMILFLPSKQRQGISKLSLGFIFAWLGFFLIKPNLFWPFIASLRSTPMETGSISPNFYSFVWDVFGHLGFGTANLWAWSLYIVWLIFVVAVFVQLIKKLSWQKDKKQIIFFCLLTFFIAFLRVKDYSYLLIMPVVYALVEENWQLIFLPLANLFHFIVRSNYYLLTYNPFFVLVFFWFYFVKRVLDHA